MLSIPITDKALVFRAMQERLRLAGWTMVIESKPLAGTTIRVRVRFRAKRPSLSGAALR
jgi:signal transduction histidine kinase